MWCQSLSVLNPYEALVEYNSQKQKQKQKQKERKRKHFIFWRNRKDVSVV